MAGAGSYPSSFNLASFNIGDLANAFGVSAPPSLAGVGGRVGPTGTASLTTGVPSLDTALSFVGNAIGVPLSQNMLSLASTVFGGPVLGALAGLTGPFGALLTITQLTHALASNIEGTLANQIASVMANPELTPEMQAQFLSQLNAQGPMSGGPQSAIGPGNLGGTGPSGSAFGLDFSNPSVRSGFEAQDTSPKGREDVGPTAPTAPPDVPDITATGDVGIGGGGAGTGAPSGSATGGGSDAATA